MMLKFVFFEGPLLLALSWGSMGSEIILKKMLKKPNKLELSCAKLKLS